jgi:hypothetical protein
VQDSEKPQNITSLQAYLELVNYYGKFISKLADVSAPLNELLKKEKPLRWERERQEAWLAIKQLLYSTHPNFLLTSVFNMGVKANMPFAP